MHVKNSLFFAQFILATVSHSAGYTTRALISQPRHPHLPIQLFYLRATAVEHIFESRRKYLRHLSHKKSTANTAMGQANKISL
jgi:hypothetical protein